MKVTAVGRASMVMAFRHRCHSRSRAATGITHVDLDIYMAGRLAVFQGGAITSLKKILQAANLCDFVT